MMQSIIVIKNTLFLYYTKLKCAFSQEKLRLASQDIWFYLIHKYFNKNLMMREMMPPRTHSVVLLLLAFISSLQSRDTRPLSSFSVHHWPLFVSFFHKRKVMKSLRGTPAETAVARVTFTFLYNWLHYSHPLITNCCEFVIDNNFLKVPFL